MKKTRTRDVNIAIEIVFHSFEKVFNRNFEKAQKEDDENVIRFRLKDIEQAGDTIRDELFGMRLVGAFTWREYLVLREKTRRIETEYKNAIKNL